jgi:carboxymethylenebutenolidase
MMALNMEQAAKDMLGAVDYLLAHPSVHGKGIGVTGFCMGGGLALMLATMRPDAIKACVPFYGLIPWPAHQPDFSKLEAAVQGHYAEGDDFFTPENARQLEADLRGMGKDVEMFVHPGCDHAFTNHHRPEVFHEEETKAAWDAALPFLHAHLDA